ncbi:hypothetical protein [Weissella cibaria]|uniref:Uncharacterized protein n=1 Tax=Weissella cibaria TaxID=137591 RepID=A0A9Q8JHW4_9LACO|nr:hypothetical protein [Weissella cibaria]TVV27217.1 hypothetical protein FO435_04670 [Weissella cibaria]TVV40415.1 hypothetical protein FO438_04510 [Weissella cibaria]
MSKLAIMGLTMAGAIAFGQSNASVSADAIKAQYQGNWFAHQNGRWYHVNVTKNHVTGTGYTDYGRTHTFNLNPKFTAFWNAGEHGYYLGVGNLSFQSMYLGLNGNFTTLKLLAGQDTGTTIFYRSKDAALGKYFTATVQHIDATTKKKIGTDWHVKSPAAENWWFEPGNGYQYYQLQGSKRVNYKLNSNRTFKIYYKATYRKLTIKNYDFDTGKLISTQTKMVKVGTTPLVQPGTVKGYQAYSVAKYAKRVNLDQTMSMTYRKAATIMVKYQANEGTQLNPKWTDIANAKTYTSVIGKQLHIAPVQNGDYVMPAAQDITVTGNRTIVLNYQLNKQGYLNKYNQAITNKHFDATHTQQLKAATNIYYTQMKSATSASALKKAWNNFNDVMQHVTVMNLNVYDMEARESDGRPQFSDRVTLAKSVTNDNQFTQSNLWQTQLHAWLMYNGANRKVWVSGAKAGSGWIDPAKITEGTVENVPVSTSITDADTSMHALQATSMIAYESKTTVDLTTRQKMLASDSGFHAYIAGYTIYHNVFGSGNNIVYMTYKSVGTPNVLGANATRMKVLQSSETQIRLDGRYYNDLMVQDSWSATENGDWASWFVIPGQYTDDDIANATYWWLPQYAYKGYGQKSMPLN